MLHHVLVALQIRACFILLSLYNRNGSLKTSRVDLIY
jgi:hypothetical protein